MQALIEKYQRIIVILLCGFIVVYGVYGAFSALTYSLADSQDVHLQWFPGQKILLGLNPYTVDNADEAGLMARPGFGHLPTNTPVMNLLFLPISLLDWDTAGWVVRLLNYTLAVVCVLLAFRLLPQRYPLWLQGVAVMAFMGIQPVRETIMLGQTSLIILFTMLLAVLLAPRNQWLAGLAFGIALSKYSMSLPLALWFVVFGYWRVLIVAALVQVGGFALLSLLTRQDILEVVRQYIDIARGLVDEPGTLDMFSTARRVNAGVFGGVLFSLLLVVVTLAVTAWRYGWRTLFGLRAAADTSLSSRNMLFALLAVLALIVVYHRSYDAVLLILLPVAIASLVLQRHDKIELTRLLTAPGFLLSWLVYFVLILPTRTIASFIPDWVFIYQAAQNVLLVGVFAVLCVLVVQNRQAYATETMNS